MSTLPTPIEVSPEEEEAYSSWALCILCMLLIGALWTSYYLQVRKIRAVHETVVSIFAGMVVGLVLRLSPGHMIREMLTFKHTLFFNLLLPPIILNSGYELKQENFFRNFAVILTFAFVGTFISAIGLGVLVYLWSFTGLEGLKFTLLECLIFGSTLSATDPVTILSIFNTYKVDPKLYSIIFGESLLNDAVSIVLYETLSQFHGEDIFATSLFHGVAIFLLQFSISMALGVIFGLASSLMLKHSSLHLYPGIESCIITLLAFTSYFLSAGMHMSGIVSLLFCGITLKHYAYHSMSRRTQRTTKYMFAILAQLSENFIFIYLGLNLFAQEVQVFKPLFILVTAVSVMAARYAAIFPLSEIINWIFHARGQTNDEIPYSYQMMLFWSGLRGAVGVALAVGIKGENADALRTTVLVVVVLTVIVFGGTTARMLEILGIRTGVEEDEDSSDEEDHWSTLPGGMAMQNGPGSRRYAGQNGRSLGGGGYRSGRKGRGFLGANGGGDGYQDAEEGDERGGVYSTSPTGSTSMLPRDSYRTSIGDRLDHPPPRSANAALARGFSTNTSSSEEDEEERSDDGELLPSAHSLDLPRSSGSRHHQPAHPPRQHPASPPKSGLPRRSTSGRGSPSIATGDGSGGSREGMVFRDGQWFTALDERYLLPLFSNSVASRRHHARRQSRMASAGSRGADGGERGVGEEGSSGEEEGGESENGKVKQPPNNFSGSVSDFFNSFSVPSSPNPGASLLSSSTTNPVSNPLMPNSSPALGSASGSASGSGSRSSSTLGSRSISNPLGSLVVPGNGGSGGGGGGA